LVAFISQGITDLTNFLALVDSYDTLRSKIPDFLAVSYGLMWEGGAAGLRELGHAVFADWCNLLYAKSSIICASNDSNENELIQFVKDGPSGQTPLLALGSRA
jgi:hypothetical protein